MRLRLLDANRVLMYHRGRGTHQEAMADKIARDTAAWLERNR
ncbi:hypothetical protein [Flagellatimonas centrodinii]|nr:hypothetical protein [Flagellatimonas centrodinii]